MDRAVVEEFDEARDAGLAAVGAARFVAYQRVRVERGLPELSLAEAVRQVAELR